MADAPEIPDPNKAKENKLSASFVWTPDSTVSKAAASAAGASARNRAPSSMLERVMAQGPGKLALSAVILLAGGLLFSFAAYRFAGTPDGSGGGTALGGVASSMKIRFARANDPTGYIMREKAKGNEKMRFDLIAGAADKAAADKAAGGRGAPGENGAPGGNGDAPMNYDESQSSRGGAGGGPSAGGATGPGKDGEQGGAGGVAGGAGARLGSSYGSIKFQGMKRISSTAGFRGIQGRRGAPTKTISTKGSASNSSAATKPDPDSGGSSLASAGGKGSNAAGVGSGKAAAGGTKGGGSPDGGGGGGGGDGGTFDTDGIEATQNSPEQIGDLISSAKKDREKAEDEKKKAMALMALGQAPQAAYHYDRSKKATKSAKEKEDEANRMLSAINEAARAAATPQQPPP